MSGNRTPPGRKRAIVRGISRTHPLHRGLMGDILQASVKTCRGGQMGDVLRFHARSGGLGGRAGPLGAGLANAPLLGGALGKGQVVETKLSVSKGDKDISQPQLDCFPRIGNLVAHAPGGSGLLGEGFTGLNGQRGVKTSEVHAASLPMGNLLSRPIGKLPSDTLAEMDVYERRRLNLIAILKEVPAAALAKRTGIAATYISRCKSEPGTKGHKVIGEEIARKIEGGVRAVEGWLDQDHQKADQAEKLPTPQDLADLADARLILLPNQWEDIRARAAQVRAMLNPKQSRGGNAK